MCESGEVQCPLQINQNQASSVPPHHPKLLFHKPLSLLLKTQKPSHGDEITQGCARSSAGQPSPHIPKYQGPPANQPLDKLLLWFRL